MKINDIEKIVILAILADNGKSFTNKIWFEDIVVLDRFYTGVGFFMKISPSSHLAFESEYSTSGVDCDVLLNGEILIGFTYYMVEGYLESIEGYTYEEPWPEKITTILDVT